MAHCWQVLSLENVIPRPQTILQDVELMRGLRPLQFWARFAFAGTVFCLGGFAFLGTSLLLLAIFLGLLAFKLHQQVQSRLKWRHQSLLQGLPVSGSLIRQRQRFTLLSYRPQQVMTVKFWLEQHEQSASGILWKADLVKELPLGTQVIGLWLKEQNTIWLPLEIGLTLQAETVVPQAYTLDDVEPDSTSSSD